VSELRVQLASAALIALAQSGRLRDIVNPGPDTTADDYNPFAAQVWALAEAMIETAPK